MTASRIFDLIGKTFAVLIFGAFLILVLYTIVAALVVIGTDSLVGLFVAIASIAGIVLVVYGAWWSWKKLGKERQASLLSGLGVLMRCAYVGALVYAVYVVWEVPEISNRPLGSLTLNDIAQNVFKFSVLFFGGGALLRWLLSRWW